MAMSRTLAGAAILVSSLVATAAPVARAQQSPPPLIVTQTPPADDLPLPPPRCIHGWESKLFFTRDHSEIADSAAEEILDISAREALACKPVSIVVGGHSDSGEATAISLARARTVQAALVKRGVNAALLKLSDFGTSRPVRPPPDVRNRRVTMTFTYP
jgi:outer membrane protein OmpA-like peptidoglycan-associated protein